MATDMTVSPAWQYSKGNIKYFPPSPEEKFVPSSKKVPEIRPPRDPITEGDTLPDIGIKTNISQSPKNNAILRIINERAGFIQDSSENRKLNLMSHQRSSIFPNPYDKIGVEKERIKKLIHRDHATKMGLIMKFNYEPKNIQKITEKVTRSTDWDSNHQKIVDEYHSNRNASSIGVT
jgi:hypothetical protein